MKINLFSACILLLVFALILVLPQTAFCQETITITTYYPAPFGVYEDLFTERLGVGIGTDEPNAAIEVNDSILYRPRTGNPATWAGGEAGELAYSSANDGFYYYNGSSWVSPCSRRYSHASSSATASSRQV